MRLFKMELIKILGIVKNDPRAVAAGIIAPSIALIMFTLLFGGLSPMPVGIVNKDDGPWGLKLENDILAQISPLGDMPYFAKKETDENIARQKYRQGKLVGIIVIPKDFSQRLEHQRNPEIIYYFNNFNTDFAKNMRLYLREGIYAFDMKTYPDIQARVEEVITAPCQVEWIDIIAVGTLLLAFIIGGMFNYLYVFFKEKQYGTLLFYQISPVNPLPSFAARLVFACLSSILAGLVNASLIYLILDFNVFVYLLDITGAVSLTVLTYICLSAIFCVFMDNFYGAVMGAMGGAMLLWFFSGGFSTMVPENALLLLIYRVVPNSYALDLMRGQVFGATSLNDLTNYGVLTGMAFVSLVFALYLFKRNLAGIKRTRISR